MYRYLAILIDSDGEFFIHIILADNLPKAIDVIAGDNISYVEIYSITKAC